MGDIKNKRKRSLAGNLQIQLIITTVFCISIPVIAVSGERSILIPAGISAAILACVISIYLQIYLPLKKVEKSTDLLLRNDNTDLSMNFQELVDLLKESVDREYTADILKKEAELKALQSQINPHFLYNVLDGIRGHAMAEGVTELAEMTEALSKIFRYSVSHWENEVSLDCELTNIRAYFKIQQYRFNNRFDLQITIEDDEDETLACRLPKLTLQPIVENAIYHGLETKLDQGLVKIRTRLAGDFLLIEISDDGSGAPAEVLEKVNSSFSKWKTESSGELKTAGMGIALTNVNSRIKMMYGEEYGLHMFSTEGFGAMIEILLPRRIQTYE